MPSNKLRRPGVIRADNGFSLILHDEEGLIEVDRRGVKSPLISGEGSVGPEGPEGPEGPQGDPGNPGADGASAYDIAVDEGFVGDESAWIASLKGDQGPQGEPGGGGITINDVIDALYPVGSLYTSTLATNPGTLLGRGTWAVFGAGRVMVGRDSGDADFDTGEETGGAKTHTHAGHSAHVVTQPTAATESAHTHTYTGVPNHVHVQRLQGGTTGTTTGTHLMGSAATGGSLRSSAQSTLDPTGGVGATGTTAAGSAHGHTLSGAAVDAHSAHDSPKHLMPYVVVYMWKRTA
jgi:hypothetical protein